MPMFNPFHCFKNLRATIPIIKTHKYDIFLRIQDILLPFRA